ncbi:MAG TPA: substrate-binding domain-containing protein, partial [Candidatus Baltobacteraceae bacterium]
HTAVSPDGLSPTEPDPNESLTPRRAVAAAVPLRAPLAASSLQSSANAWFRLRARAFLAGALLIVASLSTWLFLQRGAGSAPLATIRICGSSTATSRLASDFAREFFTLRRGGRIEASSVADQNRTTISAVLPGDVQPTRIEITGEGSSRGFAALAQGSCDLVISLRRIHDDEASAIAGLRGRVIGRDGIVVAVSSGGHVDRLTEDQLQGIFSGEVSSWAQLGGPDHKIDLIVPDDESEYDSLRSALLNDQDPSSAAAQLPMAAIASALAVDPDAIAIDSYSALGSARALRILGHLNTLVPSLQNIQTGSYPFTSRLYAYTTRGRQTPALLPAFVSYLQSSAAESVLNSDGLLAAR